jgi:hypothetical protein
VKSEAVDALTRSLTGATPRRGLLRALAATGGVLGIGANMPRGAVGKNKKRKHKHKKDNKPKNNEFGCLDVGKACDGKDEKCCSGICEGKKPKHGKKDKSKCAAHNSSICQPGIDVCQGIQLECNGGFCFQTTGKAPSAPVGRESAPIVRRTQTAKRWALAPNQPVCSARPSARRPAARSAFRPAHELNCGDTSMASLCSRYA